MSDDNAYYVTLGSRRAAEILHEHKIGFSDHPLKEQGVQLSKDQARNWLVMLAWWDCLNVNSCIGTDVTQEQYDEYDHYTIVRDPLERWISAYGWKCRNHRNLKITPTEFYENNYGELVCRNQSEYLSLGGVRTFPFSDFENSVRTIMQLIGGRLEDIPFVAHTKQIRILRECKIEVTQNDAALERKILTRYADDLQLEF